ncbi:MAG: AMP-dependent synthetase [Proteobacteria bacterium]|nr:MAG: AMP-dependent synthetase [Pseudomonadota bacterium]
MVTRSESTQAFINARQFLLDNRDDYERAYAGFHWPVLGDFNWATDWFDRYARGNNRTALHILSDQSEQKISFEELSDRSSRIAQGLLSSGIKRGDRILIMLGNSMALWEAVLASQKIGAVLIPTATQATPSDLDDRLSRGNVKAILTDIHQLSKFEQLPLFRKLIKFVDHPNPPAPWTPFDQLRNHSPAKLDGLTHAEDPFLLYFTSGTTAKPKLVLHTHQSYPVGHLSTMYWIGIREHSIHQNISSPGWAKHAWSSLFAPWNAGATVLVHEYARFQAETALAIVRDQQVNSLCAPPTVWRMLIISDLGAKPKALQELVSAGEPLNPEIIDQVQERWGITIRDGYGQTETTAQIGNSPGAAVIPGKMGRPLPGYKIVLLNSEGRESIDGEVALKLGDDRPLPLMQGYMDDEEKTQLVMAGGYYRTGDEASLSEDGYYQFVGRGDDVFKSSDYRISPFELESVLLECDLVAESAVIPSPDPLRLNVPKAIIILKPGQSANAETARAIFAFQSERLPSYKQLRRIEFSDLPKTISGKIRRVQLRKDEVQKRIDHKDSRAANEFWFEDFKK